MRSFPCDEVFGRWMRVLPLVKDGTLAHKRYWLVTIFQEGLPRCRCPVGIPRNNNCRAGSRERHGTTRPALDTTATPNPVAISWASRSALVKSPCNQPQASASVSQPSVPRSRSTRTALAKTPRGGNWRMTADLDLRAKGGLL